jgi:glycerophosphoryl diester phosphodiesterase
VWTVDSKNDMERLIEMGIDGIITNRPDILKDIIRED